MRIDHAPQVGQGVPKIKSKVPRALLPTEPQTAEFDDANLSDDWSETQTIPEQINEPKLWKPVKKEVKIFDLALAPDLEAYNTLLTKASVPGSNLFIQSSETSFCEKTSNWKVLVTLVTVMYRKFIKKK